MENKFNVNSLEAATLPDNEYVKGKFIDTLVKLHGFKEADAEMIHSRESIFFKKAVAASEDLRNSTKISLFSVFLEIAINNLSIQPGSKSEAYLESRSARTISNGREEWIKVAGFVITTYGELNLRIRSGQILRMSNPIVVYQGDKFQPRTNQRGELYVEYEPKIPRESTNIIGVWTCIHLPNNGIDFKWLLQEDIDRLKRYATKDKRGGGTYTPELYSKNNGQIDPGFLEAKCIKHAMRAYTKLRLGENVSTESDYEEPEEQSFTHKEYETRSEKANQSTVKVDTVDENSSIF